MVKGRVREEVRFARFRVNTAEICVSMPIVRRRRCCHDFGSPNVKRQELRKRTGKVRNRNRFASIALLDSSWA